MDAFAFWSSLLVVAILLLRPRTRTAGCFAAVGSMLGGFYHFGYATVLDFRNWPVYLWAFALYLAASAESPAFGGWSRRKLAQGIAFLLSMHRQTPAERSFRV